MVRNQHPDLASWGEATWSRASVVSLAELLARPWQCQLIGDQKQALKEEDGAGT